MAAVVTRYEHIQIREDGIPIIAGTTMKVIELVTQKLAYGWSPEELHFQHPYLTMSQIHAALAYHWDNVDEFNDKIENEANISAALRNHNLDSPLRHRLKSTGVSEE